MVAGRCRSDKLGNKKIGRSWQKLVIRWLKKDGGRLKGEVKRLKEDGRRLMEIIGQQK